VSDSKDRFRSVDFRSGPSVISLTSPFRANGLVRNSGRTDNWTGDCSYGRLTGESGNSIDGWPMPRNWWPITDLDAVGHSSRGIRHSSSKIHKLTGWTTEK